MGLKDIVDFEEKPEKERGVPGVKSKKDIGKKPVVGSKPQREDVEYGIDEKPCPRCGFISKAESHRSWRCPNDEGCGVVLFTMGWNEWRQNSEGLKGAKINGLRYSG